MTTADQMRELMNYKKVIQIQLEFTDSSISN